MGYKVGYGIGDDNELIEEIQNKDGEFKLKPKSEQKKIPEKIIKVTLETHYIIPDYLQYDMDALIKEWFVDYANISHATKDAWHVGGSNKILQVEEVDKIDIE